MKDNKMTFNEYWTGLLGNKLHEDWPETRDAWEYQQTKIEKLKEEKAKTIIALKEILSEQKWAYETHTEKLLFGLPESTAIKCRARRSVGVHISAIDDIETILKELEE